MGKLVYLKDVVTLELSSDACTGCGMCAIVCPRGVFEVSARKAAILDRDSCMECGACARNCAFGAIRVKTGVGCATAVLNSMLRRQNTSCCCTLDQYQTDSGSPSLSGKESR
ncbi:MAG: 4Fe-4S binding protein [Desulfobacteraceae bacterium]|nr:4Fe-4S binding protein [Desulfobacteraceae bacterium]